jgi:two-component system chemotaxis sensor kinase CheA
MRDRVEALAEALVLSGPGDAVAEKEIRDAFADIRDGAPEESRELIAALCGHALAALAYAGTDAPESGGKAWAVAGRCAACLQGLICEAREPHELPLPEGLAGVRAAPAGAEAGLEEEVRDPDLSLIADFVRESLDHLETADAILLSLGNGPADGEGVNAVFRAFHTVKGVAGFLGFKGIQEFAHGTETLLDQVRDGSVPLDAGLLDVVFAAVEALRKRVEWAGARAGAVPPIEITSALREVAARVDALSRKAGGNAQVPHSAEAPAPSATYMPESAPSQAVPPKTPDRAAPSRETPPAPAEAKGGAESRPAGMKETVKVEADRLDRLLDAIGELVIAESMIFQTPEIKALRNPNVVQRMAALDKITRDLQKMGTSLRMVPIRPVFQKMAKLARDLARKAGKDVEFVCVGDETELDKTVVDKISDPLVHMVRNSVDHGIEPSPADRTAAGKPPQAKVHLRAFQKGGNVCIQIQDDGRGLDRAAILRKAREKGMIPDDGEAFSDQEVWAFIFEPGFSTAARVTEISGRGVGMDVVRRNIAELRGRIEIESVPGTGTTFSIWLPLTLAIIDGMIVKAGGQRLVVPTLSILRIVPVAASERIGLLGRGQLLSLQGELVPLFELSGFLAGQAPARSEAALAVIVECGSRKAGVLVDELLGQQQVVVKGLGESLQRVPGVSGGAILPDGTVGMILDVDGLMETLKAETAAA